MYLERAVTILNAAFRIAATNNNYPKSTTKQQAQLLSFSNKLDDKGRQFLFSELPSLIGGWYRGDLWGKQISDKLTLASNIYTKVDAIAVAMHHLKSIFPVDCPKLLFRSSEVKTTPKAMQMVELNAKNQFKPLLAFSSNRYPYVESRGFVENKLVIYSWRTEPNLVLMSTSQLSTLFHAMETLYAMKLITVPLGKYLNMSASNILSVFRKENEFTVYLSRPIHCSWELE